MKTKSGKMTKTGTKSTSMVQRPLLADVRKVILQARAVDSALTTLYWHVGRRIRQDILQNKRAGYGEEIVAALGRIGMVPFQIADSPARPLSRDYTSNLMLH